jgi:hypothetical protein
MALFGHRARPFPKNTVCGFFNLSEVSVAVLTDLKQNLMHVLSNKVSFSEGLDIALCTTYSLASQAITL